MKFAALALLAFSTIANANGPCARFVCEAYAQRPGRRTAMPRSGYGNSIGEAQAAAVRACTMDYGFGSLCRPARCEKFHGPAFPIFSSCEDQWHY